MKKNNFKTDSNRIDYLDVAKAIGMYLVILGHLVIMNYKPYRFINAFHMPLFFIISGMTDALKTQDDFILFVKKQIKHYLIPFSFVFIISIVQFFVFPVTWQRYVDIYQLDFWRNIYRGYLVISYFSATWFLICMFWAKIYFWFLIKIKNVVNKYVYALIWLTWIITSLLAKDIYSNIPLFHRLPMQMDSAMMGTVFLGVGYAFEFGYKRLSNRPKKTKKMTETGKKITALLLIVFGFLAVYFFSYKGNIYVNMLDLEYAIKWKYLIGAIMGSLMILGLSILCEKLNFLKVIGRHTLYMLIMQEIVYTIIIMLANYLFGLSLSPMRMKLDVYCVMISIASFCVTALIASIYYKIRTKVGDVIKIHKKDLFNKQ